MEITVAHPKGWELDGKIMETAEKRAKEAGGSLTFTNDQTDGLKGANFVCAKSWGALKYYGNWEEEKKIREGLKHWIVDKKKMAATNDAYFMHCLPVRRNVEVTDEAIDSKNSIVYEQAENRLWAQMAILTYLMQK
jgi:N-acetylornithine carbamoyltransferase